MWICDIWRWETGIESEIKTLMISTAGETKLVKRNRSRDMFKMRLGLRTVLEHSGDSWIEKPSGSSLCRKSLWHLYCRVRSGWDGRVKDGRSRYRQKGRAIAAEFSQMALLFR